MKRTPLKRTARLATSTKRSRANATQDAKDKKACIERDGEFCAVYGIGPVDLHHLFCKGSHPELRHDPNNHILLSRRAHTEAHENPAEFFDWLKSARPWQYEALGVADKRAIADGRSK